jgi:two-component sensor histidine kinase
MTSSPLVEAMNRELRAASPDLVGNDDLLRSVLSGCGDCIKVLDLDGRLQFMSDGGKRVMEVDDFTTLKGCPWPDFWTGDGNVQAVAAVEAAKAGKTTHFRGAANTAKGKPRYWDVQVSPIFGADGRLSQLLSISRDITEEWEAAQRERFLTEEIEHRAKNIFAIVLSVASQTFRGEAHALPLEAYKTRVMALAKAHDAAKQSNWKSARIGDVIEAALSSHRRGDGSITVAGPDLRVSPRQALSLTLAINELATNSLKYGSLSSSQGGVDISWAAAADEVPTFSFLWREHGGPSVVEPTREGFGTRVIKHLMAADFGGTVRLSYEPKGVICELKSPLENLPS